MSEKSANTPSLPIRRRRFSSVGSPITESEWEQYLPGVPFDPYRSALYSPDELYSGLEHGYDATLGALSGPEAAAACAVWLPTFRTAPSC